MHSWCVDIVVSCSFEVYWFLFFVLFCLFVSQGVADAYSHACDKRTMIGRDGAREWRHYFGQTASASRRAFGDT